MAANFSRVRIGTIPLLLGCVGSDLGQGVPQRPRASPRSLLWHSLTLVWANTALQRGDGSLNLLFDQFPPKLHENERLLRPWRPVDPPLGTITLKDKDLKIGFCMLETKMFLSIVNFSLLKMSGEYFWAFWTDAHIIWKRLSSWQMKTGFEMHSILKSLIASRYIPRSSPSRVVK